MITLNASTASTVGEPGQVRASWEGQERADDERVASPAAIQELLPARRTARLLLLFFGLSLLLTLTVCPVTPGGEHERDHESESSEREVGGGAERVLRRIDHARVLEAEDDHEPERDAGHHRAEHIADQQPLWVR
jgi:hypothetical protein